jgi:hypothetical protein
MFKLRGKNKVQNQSIIKLILFFFLILFSHDILGQKDTLVFDSGHKVIGKIKKMQRGVIEIDTDYADDEFKITWLSIKEMKTATKFRIGVKNEIFKGKIETVGEDRLRVFDKDSTYKLCTFEDVVYITELKEGFADRFSAEVEAGFNLTKAQNLRQFSLRSYVGYRTDRSVTEASYNMLRSSQDNAENVRRRDGLLSYRRSFLKKWYGVASISTLSNTEQKLDIRANTQVAFGRYLFANYRADWGVKLGVNNNLEQFSNLNETRNTWEAYLGTKLNLHGYDDFEISFLFSGYQGITESDRQRVDTTIDFKYDLPLDFFIRLGFSLNYDNKPAPGASETDYILRTGIGWEW